MSLLCVFVVLALAGATSAGQDVKELKVEVVSVPEGCTVKSKQSDMLTMHYTGTLDDGHKFDSRAKIRVASKIKVTRVIKTSNVVDNNEYKQLWEITKTEPHPDVACRDPKAAFPLRRTGRSAENRTPDRVFTLHRIPEEIQTVLS
ncbi:unnamed protein product [Plutella xylostella]|uniref:peptidylprolyl isomerase n=1 Tax=Plutella xylostella TaxID=51655 RepID=A0A8S4GC55_PLUXY|nr:unnamed protein product [Plutella xylostella]